MSSFPLLNQWQWGSRPWPAASGFSLFFCAVQIFPENKLNNCGCSPEGGAQECHFWTRPVVCRRGGGGGELKMHRRWEASGQTLRGLFRRRRKMMGKCEWETEMMIAGLTLKNLIPVFTLFYWRQADTGGGQHNNNNNKYNIMQTDPKDTQNNDHLVGIVWNVLI